MCCLQKQRDANKFPTLGFVKPKEIKKLSIQPDDPNWSAPQLDVLRQKDLFVQGPEVELQKVPFKFVYTFTCDHEGCNGHNMSCTDWEMGESWRSWKDKYGDNWQEKFRQKYETEMMRSWIPTSTSGPFTSILMLGLSLACSTRQFPSNPIQCFFRVDFFLAAKFPSVTGRSLTDAGSGFSIFSSRGTG